MRREATGEFYTEKLHNLTHNFIESLASMSRIYSRGADVRRHQLQGSRREIIEAWTRVKMLELVIRHHIQGIF